MKTILKIIALLLSVSGFSQNFYNIDKVEDIRLYFYNSNWDSKLDSLKLNNSKTRILALFEYKNIKIDSVGVRFKGNSSYKSFYKKNPLNIKLNYKNKKINIDGYHTIKLSNNFMDPSSIREVLAYKIIGNYIPSSKANFVNLYINDTLIGLYTSTETVNKDFIKNRYGNNNNSFFKCEATFDNKTNKCKTKVIGSLTLGYTLDSTCYENQYEKKSKFGWKPLIELMSSLWYNNDTSSNYYNTIERKLNINKVMIMLAFNNLFVSLDSYNYSGRNYYLYENNNNVFQIIPWDFNQCFGGFSMGYNKRDLYKYPVYMSIDNPYKPLISNLLINKKYKQMYINNYKQIIKDYFTNNKFELLCTKLHNIVATSIQNDKWYYYGTEFFKSSLYETSVDKIPGIISLMKKRIEYLKLNNPELFE